MPEFSKKRQVRIDLSLEQVISSIQSATLSEEDVFAAKEILDNEIMQCENILQDPETELYSRREFQLKLSVYRKLRNRL